MSKSKHSEAQIIPALKQVEAGRTAHLGLKKETPRGRRPAVACGTVITMRRFGCASSKLLCLAKIPIRLISTASLRLELRNAPDPEPFHRINHSSRVRSPRPPSRESRPLPTAFRDP